MIITIIQDFPIWLSLQYLIKFGSYLKSRTFFWPTHLVFSHFTHSTLYRLQYRVDKAFKYKWERYSNYGIYLCFVHLSRYKVIILKCHLITKNEFLVEHNQISFLVKLLALLLVLVRVYWLDNKGLLLVCYLY